MNALRKTHTGTETVVLTSHQEDVVRMKASLLAEEMRNHRYDSLVIKPKFSIGKLMDAHPKLFIMSIGPVALIVVGIVTEILK